MSKIPSHATKVFTGKIFDVYQWPQQLYNGTTATFEMLKRANTMQIIAVHDGKILLAKQEQPNKPPYVGFLGGRQETGEAPLDAAKRELLEEAGLVSTLWKSYRVYQPVGKIDWEVHLFIAQDCKQVAKPSLDGGEKVELFPVTFDEFIHEVTNPKFNGREFALDVFLAQRDGTLGEIERDIFE